MKAALYETFGDPITIGNVADPHPEPHGAVIEVRTTGICLSDWHGWRGHDPDILRFPHVPGHELAGVVVEVGRNVTRWKVGDRVTMPFVCGCGACPQCLSGNHQVCDHQFQPGFTHWGSFAQRVGVHYADVNLVRLSEEIDFVAAAGLGCRFVTSFRAVVAQGRLGGGQWLAVHGCGGIGLSAIMIAEALGVNAVAVDIGDEKLALARSLGATATINARKVPNVVEALREITGGGVHVSIDALGSAETCVNSIYSLRKRGKHIQVGLMVADHSHPPVPMGRMLAHELEIIGSHGMQAHRYEEMFRMILSGKLRPERLVGRRVGLEEAPAILQSMDRFNNVGITVIDRF
jgi:alcohol dehydrogenase